MKSRRILLILISAVLMVSSFLVSCSIQQNTSSDTQETNASSDNTTTGEKDDENIDEIKSYEVEQHIVLANKNFSSVDRIVIQDGITGKTVEVEEQKDIGSIIETVKQIEGVDPISNRGYYGYTYSVVFYCGEDEIFSFTVFPDVDNVDFTCGLYETVNGFDYPCRYTLINCSYEHIENTLKKFVE